MSYHKTQTFCRWKGYGLIHNDYNALYDEYINTTHCNHCQKEFKDSRDRQMDHDHDTGLFRKIVCRACNLNDTYIKYPNGFDKKLYKKEYEQKNREKNREHYKQKKQEYYQDKKEERKQKITCLCGSVIRKDAMKDHLKTRLHLNKMELYMNNID